MALTQGQLSTAQQQALLSALLRDTSYTLPTALYVSLSSTAPTSAAGAGLTEPAIGTAGYARAELDPSTGNWSAPSASGNGQEVSNAVAIDFPASTGAWASGDQFPWCGLWTDPTSTSSADLLALAEVTTPSGGPTVAAAGITLQLAIGALLVTLT